MADTTERDALVLGQALHDAGSVLDAAIVGRDATAQERRDALRALRAAMFNWRRFKANREAADKMASARSFEEIGAAADATINAMLNGLQVPRQLLEGDAPDENFAPIRFYEPDPSEGSEE